MFIIYILLGIIAVGVLLASESGKKLLLLLLVLVALGGMSWLIFWFVIIGIGLWTYNRNLTSDIFEWIPITIFLIYAIGKLHSKYKRGELTRKAVSDAFIHNWWKPNKKLLLGLIYFGVSSVILMILLIVLS